jgi:hypothetical protein
MYVCMYVYVQTCMYSHRQTVTDELQRSATSRYFSTNLEVKYWTQPQVVTGLMETGDVESKVAGNVGFHVIRLRNGEDGP